MTSSAEPRRAASTTATPRKRVAGARRRPSGEGAPVAAAAVAPRTVVLEPTDLSRTTGAVDATDTPEAGDSRDVGDTRDTTQATDTSATTGTTGTTRTSARRWPSAIAATLALAVLAAALMYGLRPTISDTDRTAAVGSARTTLESLLSYSGAAFDKHVAEVAPQLAAPFKDQFTKVAATDIKPMAVKNEATVQAKVYEAGVMDSSGDGGEGSTVRVMAFVNQATTTKAQQAPAIDQNRVIATMRKVGDRWLVSDLSAY